MNLDIKATTVVCVRKNGKVVIAGDGQVSMNNAISKGNAKKVRKIYKDKILIGFAGSVVDALTLSERFEGKLEQFGGNMQKAVIELSKDWRTDRSLRRLEAVMIVADKDASYFLSGQGDIIEPEGNVLSIGSGSPYALAAARALVDNTDLDARTIAEKAMGIAGDICVFTNHNITVEEL